MAKPLAYRSPPSYIIKKQEKNKLTTTTVHDHALRSVKT